MSPLPPNALINPAQTLQVFGETGFQGDPSAFDKVYAQAADPGLTPQPVDTESRTTMSCETHLGCSQEVKATSAPLSLPGGISANVIDVLRPKLASAGHSLETLRTRVIAAQPRSTAEALQNRLELLNMQFRSIGETFQTSAAKNDPIQLLKLQNDIYQLDEELELVTRVVDQATSGVRTLLQTQV